MLTKFDYKKIFAFLVSNIDFSKKKMNLIIGKCEQNEYATKKTFQDDKSNFERMHACKVTCTIKRYCIRMFAANRTRLK